MEPSSPVKVGAAFAAGVVVALGSALIYIRAVDARPHSAVPAPVSASNPVRQQPELISEQPAPPEPVPAVTPVAPPSPKPTTKFQPRRIRYPESSSTIRVEVSQLNPSTVTGQPAPPLVETPRPVYLPQPPARAVNEDQAQSVTGPQIGQHLYENPAPQAHVVTLQAGTNLLIRLGETLSTDHNYAGDTFRGALDAPIVIDGFIIAEKGSKVLGRVVSAQKAGRVEGTAVLRLALTEINTTDRQRVKIETGFFDKKGPGAGGEQAAKIAGGAALGAIVGAIAGGGKGAAIGAGAGGAIGTGAVLLGRGKPATLPSETRLSFQLALPATITEHLN